MPAQPKAPVVSIWGKGQPFTEIFFQSAPLKLNFDVLVGASPDEIWTDHVSNAPFAYCTGLKVRWTSDRPFGVGTKRTATVFGALQVRERFFIWEEAERRYAFYVEEFNLPGIRSLAERYQAKPQGSGSQLLWTVAVEPAAPLKPLVFVLQKTGLNSLLERYWKRKTIERFGAPRP